MNHLGKKVILIGAGNVGMSVVYASLNQSLIAKLGIMDNNKQVQEGQVLDIQDVIAVSRNSFEVFEATYADCKDADFVVITAGRPQKPGETRLEMMADNAKIMADIGSKIKNSGFTGITLIASNPVDIMTYTYLKTTGFPKAKVVGSGTVLDTSRLKYELANDLKLSTNDVVAYVVGEHGDSSVSLLSSATVSGMPLKKYLTLNNAKTKYTEDKYEELEKYVRSKAYEIINRKRATFYGIGACLTAQMRAMSNNTKEVMIAGAYLEGEYGYEGLIMGVPCVLGENGIERIVQVELSKEEKVKLDNSVGILKKYINDLKF